MKFAYLVMLTKLVWWI